jgi:hypothetical protein
MQNSKNPNKIKSRMVGNIVKVVESLLNPPCKRTERTCRRTTKGLEHKRLA